MKRYIVGFFALYGVASFANNFVWAWQKIDGTKQMKEWLEERKNRD